MKLKIAEKKDVLSMSWTQIQEALKKNSVETSRLLNNAFLKQSQYKTFTAFLEANFKECCGGCDDHEEEVEEQITSGGLSAGGQTPENVLKTVIVPGQKKKSPTELLKKAH